MRLPSYDAVEFVPLSPQLFGGQMVTYVDAGEDHASVINMNGDLWCWGRNNLGQCGVPRSANELEQGVAVPVQPLGQNFVEQKVTLVASGGKHTLALTSENRVYAFGSNQYGQLGLGLDEFEAQDCPREVVYFREKIVSWLAAGSAHSIALSIEGYAYTWGKNLLG